MSVHLDDPNTKKLDPNNDLSLLLRKVDSTITVRDDLSDFYGLNKESGE